MEFMIKFLTDLSMTSMDGGIVERCGSGNVAEA